MNKKYFILVYFFILCILSTSWYLYFSKIGENIKIIKIDPPEKDIQIENSRATTEKPENLFNVPFKYLLNNRVCDKGNKVITAVILVTSYYGNVERRSAMRRAFSNQELIGFDMRRVFLIALPPENDKSMNPKAILNENERFGDLIQGNFIEAYKNLTYKHTMGLRWAAKYCSNAKYVIKMDDDIVVDIYQLSDYLHKYFVMPTKKQLAGYVLTNLTAIREPANKWFVKKEEYEPSIYPPFLSGWFYITTPSVAGKLAKLANERKYFWIDDVFITGIIAKELKYVLHDIKHKFAHHAEYLHCCMQDLKAHNYNCPVMVAPNGGDDNLYFTYNEIMSKCYLYPCKKRPKDKILETTCVTKKETYIGHGKPLVEMIRLF